MLFKSTNNHHNNKDIKSIKYDNSISPNYKNYDNEEMKFINNTNNININKFN